MAKEVEAPEASRRLMRVLIVEDNPADVELAVAFLKRAGYPLTFDAVDNQADFQRALERGQYDLVLCDHNLRTWNGLEALEILRKSGRNVPFVVVTAVLGDEAAVDYIKQGAADYVLKHRLDRLPVAVRQALRDKAHRDESAQLHEQILAGKREWELTFDSVPDPILLLNVQGKILRANRALTELARKKFSEVIGRPCWEVISCGGQGLAECPNYQSLKTGQVSSSEKLLSLDSRVFECSASPIRDAAGNLSGSVVVLHDLTERRRGEAALRESEERFRTAFRASPEPMSISQLSNGRYVDVNDAFLRLFGFEREEVVGRAAEELKTWTDLEDRAKIFKELQDRRSIRDLQLDFRTQAGEIRTMLLAADPVEFSGETCALVISVDVTERRRLEEQFLQAQKMEAVGRLAGGVAHDFNNLLTIINGYTDLLIEAAARGGRERSQLEEIRRAGERAAALTRQLLAFSRKQVIKPTVLDLNALVEGMEKMLGRLIREDIDFKVSQARDLGQIKADPGQIEQVVMNLVVNARDAMPKGGKLTVETGNAELGEEYARAHPYVTPGNYVLLAVSDTGCGMDAETRSHIFEPFFTTKGQGKGTGLGLPTVYGIVKQSCGHVEVYSEVGKGTVFKVYFPRIDEPAKDESGRSIPAAKVAGTETVMLVEDEPGVRALAAEALKSNGYRVLEAGDAEEAQALVAQHQEVIHLLLTDVIMPGMNGKELADTLTQLRPGIKVLFISGYTADAIARHGILPDGAAFLPKPFAPRTLLERLRQTLDS